MLVELFQQFSLLTRPAKLFRDFPTRCVFAFFAAFIPVFFEFHLELVS